MVYLSVCLIVWLILSQQITKTCDIHVTDGSYSAYVSVYVCECVCARYVAVVPVQFRAMMTSRVFVVRLAVRR